MRYTFTLLSVAFVVGAIFLVNMVWSGLPVRALLLPQASLVGAVDDMATDTLRPDLFSGDAHRVVPFQMLYPAKALGTAASYIPDADPMVEAISTSHGWKMRMLLGQIGTLAAPWTNDAQPVLAGPFPVVIYLPGVTGYMQMNSFQTTELAAHGFIVVTLNQPGSVAAAVIPGQKTIVGMLRQEAVSLVAPSYRVTKQKLPGNFAGSLAPQTSIVPYLAADVGLVLDRLKTINSDPAHILHGLLELDQVGVMGMSLGAIVTAQSCFMEARVDACLMMDAPVPTEVAEVGLRQDALWISRPAADQRLERAASGGWPDEEIDAQAATIAQALSNSENGRLVQLHGLFHTDFTDLPSLQPVIGWLGQSGTTGVSEAHRRINQLTLEFFATALGQDVTARSKAIGSDFLFWSGLHVARGQLIGTVLATPPELLDTASCLNRHGSTR